MGEGLQGLERGVVDTRFQGLQERGHPQELQEWSLAGQEGGTQPRSPWPPSTYPLCPADETQHRTKGSCPRTSASWTQSRDETSRRGPGGQTGHPTHAGCPCGRDWLVDRSPLLKTTLSLLVIYGVTLLQEPHKIFYMLLKLINVMKPRCSLKCAP